MLRLSVLGSLSLRSDAGTLPPEAQQRRRIGLLALLALAGESGISRDRLQAFLWPESVSAKSRHALDQLVYAVRRSLGADPIRSEGRDLKLDGSVVLTDLDAFSTAIRDQRWADAVSVYRGPLLDGFYISDSRELESWIDSERSRIDRDYQSSLEELARQSATAGDHVATVGWWRKLASADPLSSRFAAELIRALSAAGERAAAIQHARDYQHLVRQELEIDPDPRIEALAVQLSHAPPAPEDQAISLRHFDTPELAPPALPLQPSVPSHTAIRWKPALAVLLLVTVTASLIFFERSGARTVDTSVAAKELYLRGLNAWSSRSKDGLDTSVVYFRRAIELEPTYANAYAGLANAYVLLGYSGYRPAEAMFPKAKAAALRSIELDSTLAAPYSALGLELTWERRFSEAGNAFRKSISLDPGYPTAHQWYGMLLKILGDLDGAVRETRIAAELDPLSLQIQNTYATFLGESGNPAAALRHYQKVVGEEPDSAWVRRNPWLLTNMAAVYADNGMFEKALNVSRRSVEITSRHPRSILALAAVYAKMGRPDLARRVFAQVDSTNEHYAAERAFFYADLGELDSAFIYFDKVRQWPVPVLIGLGGNSQLRGHPRYYRLLAKLGMPAPAEKATKRPAAGLLRGSHPVARPVFQRGERNRHFRPED